MPKFPAGTHSPSRIRPTLDDERRAELLLCYSEFLDVAQLGCLGGKQVVRTVLELDGGRTDQVHREVVCQPELGGNTLSV